jgi:hypothetical protein
LKGYKYFEIERDIFNKLGVLIDVWTLYNGLTKMNHVK